VESSDDVGKQLSNQTTLSHGTSGGIMRVMDI